MDDSEGAKNAFRLWSERHFARWKDELDDHEMLAIRLYKGDEYLRINSELRGGKRCAVVAQCAQLSAAVAKAPRPSDRPEVERYIADLNVRRDVEALAALAARLGAGPGTVLEDAAFTSTSAVAGLLHDKFAAEHGPSALIRFAGPIALDVAAAPTELVYGVPAEAEMLLQRGIEFEASELQLDPRGVLVVHGEWRPIEMTVGARS